MNLNLPDYPDLLANVGSACRMANLFDEAAALLNRSLHLNLARAESWNNRGQVHEDLGEFAEAYTCYQNAYSLNRTEYPSVALALAYSRMRIGEWSNDPWLPAGAPEGTEPFPGTWDLWEQGRAPYVEANALRGVPMWQGEDLTGDRLLITWEGGYGDAIWLSRYLPKLGDCVIWVPDSLERLAEERFPVDEAQVRGLWRCAHMDNPIDIYDYQTPLLSLLTHFLRDPKTIPPVALKSAAGSPGPVPGVRRSHGAANGPSEGFTGAGESRLRVGICGMAEENGVQRKHRSVPLLALEPLRAIPGVEWVSLMPQFYHKGWVHPITWVKDADGPAWDWKDTSQVIEQCDLVVSVDTAVAHLSASLGVPTWIMLPMRADWKYSTALCHAIKPRSIGITNPMEYGGNWESSIWYPGVSRIFRQTHPTDWSGVIREVADELGKLVSTEAAAMR